MDNVCHTLVGLAAARAGLNAQTRLATATLAIAANLPDVDVLVFATGIPSVAIRRGWTHGVLAQAVLPIAFAGLMTIIGRLKPAAPHTTPLRFSWLLFLSYVGVLSHVGLDYLNTYGVRLLMPFSQRWFYGDSVFIVDIWMWLLLGAGVLLARKGRRWPSRAGLVLTALYVVALMMSAASARRIVIDRWTEATGAPPQRLMVGPVPINPFKKLMIIEDGERYVLGRFSWQPRGVWFDPRDIPKNADSPWIAAARRENPDFDYILIWARFPYWEITDDELGTRVTLKDARFPQGFRGFSATAYIRKSVAARSPSRD